MTAHIAEATVRVDCGARRGPARRIWTSFGYDEINWTYTPAGRRALKVKSSSAVPDHARSSTLVDTHGGGRLSSAP